MTMLRLSRADAVLADGKLCAISRIDRDIIELQPLGEPEAVQALSHLELLALLTKGSFSVEYGYFSSRQAARRAIAGRSLLSMLSDSEQQLVFWKIAWCEAFLAAESDGEVTRSEHSCTGFIPELERRIIATARQSSGKGRLPETTMLPAPCRTSLMTWVRLWEKTRDPMALVKRSRFNGANAPKISRERESAVQGKLSEYLHPNQILIPELHRSINADIRKQNALFGPADIKPLAEVSESTVRRRVACLDQFEVCAAREGAAKAKSKYGPHGGGIQIDVPLQRIEMDEWEIDLMAILAGAGVDVTQSSLRDLAVGRYWICVAVDAATRSILAVKLSASPSVAGALATVWMAMRDKTDMARHLGCETAWPQHGHLNHVVVDNGPALVDSEFKAALSDLNIGYSVTPAGVPKLRARIERLFLTFAKILMQFLTGRTFSNTVQRGDYPSEKYAVHTADSIVQTLVRFVVDIYHNRPHFGLDGACPNDTWTKLCMEYGWSPPPGKHRLRHVLGIRLTRKLGRHGVLVCGVCYTSEALMRFFQRSGAQMLELRFDAEDMGHISIWYGDAWHAVPALIAGMEGVSLAAWEQTMQEIRQANRAASRLNQDIIDRAFARIRQLDDEQRALRRLGPINVSADDIRRAEAETFYGLGFGPAAQPTRKITDAAPPDGNGFLADVIGPATLTHPEAEQVDDNPPSSEPAQEIITTTWSFSDEND